MFSVSIARYDISRLSDVSRADGYGRTIDFVQNVPLYQIAASDPWHVWAVGGGGIFRRVSE
jgi:hypothetical protein